MTSFIRHLLTEKETSPSIFDSPLAETNIDVKALLFRTYDDMDVKVGLFGSQGRLGQGIQSVGSMAAPGDFSNIRAPVRSRLYSALTPGGGGNRNFPGVKPTRGFRCSEGFQFGGRFTDSRYSTCGQRLFDIANLGPSLGALISGSRQPKRTSVQGQSGRVSGVGAGQAPGSGLTSRQPNIPRVGNADSKKMSSSVDVAVQSIKGAPDGSAYLIRRDGYALQPVVSASVLRTVPDNRNMEGASYIVSASKSKNIGGEELGLLSNTGVTSLKYVTPKGGVLTLQRARPLTTGERRKLGRTVNDVASIDVSKDPAARLRAFASASNGGIKYSENFPGIDKPDDVVSTGKGKTTRRWVAESFDGKKPVRQQLQEISSEDISLTKKIVDSKKAIKHLDENGDPGEIAPTTLSAAMMKTDAFKSTKLPNSVTLHERADGKAYFEVPSNETFEHLGARIASDVQKQLGLNAPSVHFMGKGTRRPYLLDHPRNGIGEKALKGDNGLDSVDPKDMLSIAVADWLVDERLRTPGNIVVFNSSDGDGAMASSNRLSGLAGLGKTEISRRQKLKLDEMFTDIRRGVYSSSFEKISASQRQSLMKQLDKLIKDADSFNWDEYYSRLIIDGELSDAERKHMKIVQSIYQNRLNTLRSSKERFLRAVGVK